MPKERAKRKGIAKGKKERNYRQTINRAQGVSMGIIQRDGMDDSVRDEMYGRQTTDRSN